MISKTFISPAVLLEDSFRLARAVCLSGFRPDTLIVLWRGGTPVGMVVHEFLLYKGLPTRHAVLRAESYDGIGKQGAVRVEGADEVLRRIRKDSRVLVIDDIFDTGRTLRHIRRLLSARTRYVRTAALYYRVRRRSAGGPPDFFVRRTTRWLVFPHELMDLTPADIRRKGRTIARLVLSGTPPAAPTTTKPSAPRPALRRP